MVLGDGNGFARIGGYLYNSDRNSGNYNEYEGNVWGDVRIVLENDNSLTAKAHLGKMTAPDQSMGELIFDQNFIAPIWFETEYLLSIELSARRRGQGQ